MSKMRFKCPKCSKVFEVEASQYGYNTGTLETFQPMRCPYCGAWTKMKKKT